MADWARAGWIIVGDGKHGHYVEPIPKGRGKSRQLRVLCGGGIVTSAMGWRRWSVSQDIGKVWLCETCKEKLRAA